MTDRAESMHDPLDDLYLIERVLWGLWAPSDVPPDVPPVVLTDPAAEALTVHQVIRARNAFERIRSGFQHEAAPGGALAVYRRALDQIDQHVADCLKGEHLSTGRIQAVIAEARRVA
jgi:hypothetical protein